MAKRLLQICPHDDAPFGELCLAYQQAGEVLGVQVVTVFLGSPSEARVQNEDSASSVHYLAATDLSDTKSLVQRLNALAAVTGHWDLLICHRYRAYAVAVKAGVAAKRKVAVAHEFEFFSRWQRRLHRRLFARDFEFAGVSAQVAQDLAMTAGTAHVLPNVLNLEKNASPLGRKEALAQLGLSPGPVTIGVVGRLHYKKRPQLALDAFAEFTKQHSADARLVFIGEGDFRASIEQRANVREAEGTWQQNVHLLGQIPHAARLFPAFDVLLHTCDVEAFGMVALEAMWAGVPVVASPRGGLAYVLDEVGYFAKTDSAEGFAEALHQAISADRVTVATQSQSRVNEHFTVAALSRHIEQLIG